MIVTPHPTALDLARALPKQSGLCFLDAALGDGPSRVFWDPEAIFQCKNGVGRLTWRDGGVESVPGDPFGWLAGFLAEHPGRVAAGYWGYDLRLQLERLPQLAQDDLALPDCWIGLYKHGYCYSPTEGRGHWRLPEEERAPIVRAQDAGSESVQAPFPGAAMPLPSSMSRGRYRDAVKRVLEYIAAGDCYQVNLSQRFQAPLSGAEWALYERLRAVSPAPYAAFLHAGDHCVLSSSPELFLRVDSGRAETRPIKGTRPRGATPEEDLATRAALLRSEKDRAELLMIVDLERNDLGRVSEYGSVTVPELNRLESYSNVHHLVATVRSRLRAAAGPLDALRALFPGGSITGAPKIRAMEIIEELEPVRRGVYTGAIGWVDGAGSGVWNIAIRTMVTTRGQVYLHAGGGIVADSDPEAEYQETLTKAQGMFRALGVAG